MPVERVGEGYRWGKHGKVYTGPHAKAQAIKQGVAISYSEKAEGKKPDIPVKGKKRD